MHLPKSRDARFRLQQAPAMPDIIGCNFVVDGRSWPNKRHMPHQDIPELWNLVQAGATDKFANPGDTGIVCQFVDASTTSIQGVRLCAPSYEICYVFF